MIEWLSENWGTLLVAGILILVVTWILIQPILRKKSGKTKKGCCGDCSRCSGC